MATIFVLFKYEGKTSNKMRWLAWCVSNYLINKYYYLVVFAANKKITYANEF